MNKKKLYKKSLGGLLLIALAASLTGLATVWNYAAADGYVDRQSIVLDAWARLTGLGDPPAVEPPQWLASDRAVVSEAGVLAHRPQFNDPPDVDPVDPVGPEPDVRNAGY